MSEDELRLNSLSRFSKRSSRLHLEEHGHCEVPAGCGGVVLRWINPAIGIPLALRIYSPGKVLLLIDGSSPTSSRPLIPPGKRILAAELNDVIPGQGLIMFAAAYDHKAKHGIDGGNSLAFVSAADGTWFFSTIPPRDDTWHLSDDDTTGWDPMVECPIEAPDGKTNWRASRTFEELTKIGARPIGLPAPPEVAPAIRSWKPLRWLASPSGASRSPNPIPRLWIRKAFQVAPGGRQ